MIGEIRTRRLLLVPFGEKHLTARYVAWLNDRDLMRYSEQRHRIHTLESCRAYLESFAGTPNHFWAIEEEAEGLGHIGNVTAYVDDRNSLADIGIVIGERQAQKKGYGLEAWIGACGFFFEEHGVRKVTAGTLAVNVRMLALMKAAGMIADGIRIRHLFWEGEEVDVVHMALFRSGWAEVAGRLKHLRG